MRVRSQLLIKVEVKFTAAFTRLATSLQCAVCQSVSQLFEHSAALVRCASLSQERTGPRIIRVTSYCALLIVATTEFSAASIGTATR